ncbi:hypothetical protein ACJX0J_021783 [Zea mays]
MRWIDAGADAPESNHFLNIISIYFLAYWMISCITTGLSVFASDLKLIILFNGDFLKEEEKKDLILLIKEYVFLLNFTFFCVFLSLAHLYMSFDQFRRGRELP